MAAAQQGPQAVYNNPQQPPNAQAVAAEQMAEAAVPESFFTGPMSAGGPATPPQQAAPMSVTVSLAEPKPEPTASQPAAAAAEPAA
eukprot:scaffold219426_cov47-Prasinocladus_malaysianus.AAC.3